MARIVRNKSETPFIGDEDGDVFKLGDVIGEGGFGTVRLCHDPFTDEIVGACKTMKAEILVKKPDKWLQEINTLRILDGHEHIVELRGVYVDHKAVHMVMELCSEGDLFSYMASVDYVLPEIQAARIIRQLLVALEFCHKQGIVHRDVKPENILVSHFRQYQTSLYDKREPHIKLGDFGSSVQLCPSLYGDLGVSGSAPYMAPEIMLGLPYCSAVDLWSVGVVAFFLLLGSMPFSGTTVFEVMQSIYRDGATLHDEVEGKISNAAWDFLWNLLSFNPEERLTAAEALAHPWILLCCGEQAEYHHAENKIC